MMSDEKLETRVGFTALAILRDITADYVREMTVNGRYEGHLHYLRMLEMYNAILEEEKTR